MLATLDNWDGAGFYERPKNVLNFVVVATENYIAG